MVNNLETGFLSNENIANYHEPFEIFDSISYLGDMLFGVHISEGFRSAPAEYLYRAILYILCKLQLTQSQYRYEFNFIFASDDITWVKKEINNEKILQYLTMQNQSRRENHSSQPEIHDFLESFFNRNQTLQVPEDVENRIRMMILDGSVHYEYLEYEDRGLVLSLLSEFDHIIITVGTFGFWAAMLTTLRDCVQAATHEGFLTRRIVLYYTEHAAPFSGLRATYDYPTYFPTQLGWKGIYLPSD